MLEPEQEPGKLEGYLMEGGGEAGGGAMGGECGRSEGGTRTGKDTVRSKTKEDRPSSCSKERSAALVTPADGAIDVGP